MKDPPGLMGGWLVVGQKIATNKNIMTAAHRTAG
jgi:hypothetical protein